MPVTKPIPCTMGNLMLEEAPCLGSKLAFTENASRESLVIVVEVPSSVADRMSDWMPKGLIMKDAGEPGMSVRGLPNDF